MYRFFDGAIACDFPLSGIPETTQLEPDLRVVTGHDIVIETDFDWFHSWLDKDGEHILACARQMLKGTLIRYLLRFPDLADFVVTGNTIACHPGPACRNDSLRHLVLDQVLPRVWAHQGHLVLHASAVQIPDGRVIAFMGDSGWGKSTLAAALQVRGSKLLGDDTISLKAVDSRVQLIPSYPGLRLNKDSIATLGIHGKGWAAMSHYSGKQRLLTTAHTDEQPHWLDALYVMQEPEASPVVSVEELAGAELIPALIKRSFLLDINDSQCAARQMREAGAVMRTIPNILSLAFPRHYRELPELCDAVLGAPRW